MKLHHWQIEKEMIELIVRNIVNIYEKGVRGQNLVAHCNSYNVFLRCLCWCI